VTQRRRGDGAAAGELELFESEPPRQRERVRERPRDSRRSEPARAESRRRESESASYFVEGEVPGATAASAVSIVALTRTAQAVLEGAFTPLWVRGEVSDFKAHRNGHWYFCLRDDEAQLRCVVWSRDRRRIPAPPDDGMQIVAFGQPTMYAARGEMQFSVMRMEAEGDGLWRKALELTRARLAADGLLDPQRKRAIPRYPRRVAVITSRDGAALHDILAVVQRRCPSVEIVLVAATVQGDSAPESLCHALDMVSRWGDADVLIIGRGGGARDDLRAFNDERVARALAACPIPTISAVGHEIDVSICDLVADVRAPTPSAAAEAAVPVQAELRERVRRVAATLTALAEERIASAHESAESAARRIGTAAAGRVESRRLTLEASALRLNALSPLATLGRGYALARDAAGRTIRSVASVRRGDAVEIVLHDGIAAAEVTRVSAGAPVAPLTGLGGEQS
jgi:exodeoxyribonuclease VII large subunit